jgi:hypothetical protein
MDTYPPAVQWPALLLLGSALKSRKTALRRDECGDWRILGRHGHIYAVPIAAAPSGAGYQLMVLPEAGSARGWTAAKQVLNFARLTNDGDTEGAFILDRLPTQEEAARIRRVLGIAKRKELSPEHVQKLREGLLRAA